jgi:TctA family transporter
MAETLHNLYLGFSVALTPNVLLYAFVGCIIGTLVGVLPGVGPLAGISLLLPATFGLNATSAMVLLAGIYYGAMYGGSTTSILMRIPGEAASVMTCIDGYAMTRKGRGGPALAVAAAGSYVAGTVSVVALMLLAPPLASFALRFGPPEYFSLLLLGLLVLAYMSGGSMLKSLAMAALGLLFGMIGIDPMTGFSRFTYGLVELSDGIGVLGDFIDRRAANRARGHQAQIARASPIPRGMARFAWADRPGHGSRFFDRHHTRFSPYHLVIRFLCSRAAPIQAPGAFRTRRHRGRCRTGVGK